MIADYTFLIDTTYTIMEFTATPRNTPENMSTMSTPAIVHFVSCIVGYVSVAMSFPINREGYVSKQFYHFFSFHYYSPSFFIFTY